MDTGLKGKTALITGGSTGIGLGIAAALADEAVHLAIASRRPDPQAIEQLNGKDVDVLAIQADVSQEASVLRMVDTAINHFGHVDLYVNNAAAHWDEPVTGLTADGWFNTINTNLSSCVFACRQCARHMIERESGSILIIGSTAIWNPLPNETSYRVSKTGLRAYMGVLAVELAPYQIRVNMLSPGAFHTRMTQDLDPRLFDELAQREIPLRRVADPPELGPSAVLLLSDKLSPYTTGAELLVDGGFHLRPVPIHSLEELRRLNRQTETS